MLTRFVFFRKKLRTSHMVWQQSNVLSPKSKINVAEWPSGVCFVTLRAEGTTVTKRLAVSRL